MTQMWFLSWGVHGLMKRKQANNFNGITSYEAWAGFQWVETGNDFGRGRWKGLQRGGYL